MKKYAWVLALFAALALVFIGCDDGNKTEDTTLATWEIDQEGGVVGTDNIATADTTAIVIKFSKSVDLAASGVTVATGSTATVTLGTPARGTGYIWTVPVTEITTAGTLRVSVSGAGIASGIQEVDIYKVGSISLINYTVVADGTANTVTSTKLTFTFDRAVTELVAGDITISPSGNVTAGALTGSGTAWELALAYVGAQGAVSVSITNDIIVASSKSVTLNYVEPTFTGSDLTVPTPTVVDTVKLVYEITGEDLVAIKAAYAENAGTKLLLSFVAPEDSSGTDRSGWGIGTIGDNTDLYRMYPLTAPQDAVKAGFDIEVWVLWAIEAIGAEGDPLYIITSVSRTTGVNQNELVGIKLLTPEGAATPEPAPTAPAKPAQVAKENYEFVQEISTIGGEDGVDVFSGKGNIVGADLAAIRAAEEGAVLRFYIINPTNANWGIGQVGGVNIPNATGVQNEVIDMTVESILTAVGPTATEINVNVWSETKVALCELWQPRSGYTPPVYELTLGANDPYGYQGFLESLFSEAIVAGDTYELSFTFTADRAVTDLEFFLLDNSQDAGWWTELSSRTTSFGFAAEEEVSKTLTFTATGSAKSSSATANKIAVTCGTGAGGVVILEFWALTLTKTSSGDPGTGPGSDPNVVFGAAVASGTSTVVNNEDGSFEYLIDNYGWDGYAYFPVNLGGAKLSDYSSISFTVTASGSDPNYKKAFLWASNGTSFSASGEGKDQAVGGPGVGGAADNWNYSSGTQSLTIAIDGTLADTLAGTGSEIYLAIYLSSSSANLVISDLVLNK